LKDGGILKKREERREKRETPTRTKQEKDG
jgi:hypothetical protein